MRHCKHCGKDKPYDVEAKPRNSKAMGFYGTKCWDCHITHMREYQASRTAKMNEELAWAYANPGRVRVRVYGVPTVNKPWGTNEKMNELEERLGGIKIRR